ncbi:MAG: hypothetical protein IJY82_06800 [Oscillospiraceae bacterium]|nr:hypothetical protein [Oscillospiraceae bacterium]
MKRRKFFTRILPGIGIACSAVFLIVLVGVLFGPLPKDFAHTARELIPALLLLVPLGIFLLLPLPKFSRTVFVPIVGGLISALFWGGACAVFPLIDSVPPSLSSLTPMTVSLSQNPLMLLGYAVAIGLLFFIFYRTILLFLHRPSMCSVIGLVCAALGYALFVWLLAALALFLPCSDAMIFPTVLLSLTALILSFFRKKGGVQ